MRKDLVYTAMTRASLRLLVLIEGPRYEVLAPPKDAKENGCRNVYTYTRDADARCRTANARVALHEQVEERRKKTSFQMQWVLFLHHTRNLWHQAMTEQEGKNGTPHAMWPCLI